ncbi:MAG: DUF1934 domain-containing protein [Lachnospiraceae bacterium]|nr:DUF1934 domain-containing protein [Lachnospiraceae bacterium]
MDREVLITVSGVLFTGEDAKEKDNVDIISPGQYYLRNGKHYLLYEEMMEEYPEPVKNIIKISPDHVSLRKNGIISTEMRFEEGKHTQSHYSTPFGVLALGIHTNRIQMEESGGEVNLDIEYGLEINYEHASENRLHVRVQPKCADGSFSLRS